MDISPMQLESILNYVDGFASPKIKYEQYETSPYLAAQILFAIQENDNIKGSSVLDLGVGTGRLAIGCIAMEASYVLGIDIDPDALEQCKANCDEIEESEEDDKLLAPLNLLQADVMSDEFFEQFHEKFDIIVMNPPFGTKKNPGIDMEFLKRAISLSPRAVYSLHKTSTRDHVLKKAREFGIQEPEVIANLRWDLPKSYNFHKMKTKDINVDLFRFCK